MSLTLRKKRAQVVVVPPNRFAVVTDRVGPAAVVAQEWATPRVEAARAAAAPRVEAALAAAAAQAEAARLAATPRVEAAIAAAQPKLEAALEAATHQAQAARAAAAPRVEAAVDKARDEVIPKMTAAVTAALAAGEPVVGEARDRGTAAIQALRGDLAPAAPAKSGRLRRLVLLLFALGGAYAAWRTYSARTAPDPWAADTTYTPPSSSEPTTPSANPIADQVESESAAAGGTWTPVSDDAGGAGPDEALADAEAEVEVIDPLDGDLPPAPGERSI